VVVWTVNDMPRMTELMQLRVDGIISDRPDLLYQAVAAFDANGDNRARRLPAARRPHR
jgi:glycerophosphoryl diester phosphodiesterase